jgi:two-component system, NarL family, invasion response regulator UvrY
VIVVSEQALARAGCEAILNAAGIHNTAVAHSLDDGIAMAGASHWDVMILDLSSLNSLASALTILRSRCPGLPILVMGEVPESQVARSVLQAGARGYFDKGGSAAALKSAVQTVLVGRRYMSASITEHMQSNGNDTWKRALHERLSARELEVFEKLAQGTSVTDIGHELSISIKTVSTHRARLLRKMGFSSNADIISYAIRNGLVS